jgi:hypothetical protein
MYVTAATPQQDYLHGNQDDSDDDDWGLDLADMLYRDEADYNMET